jgi:DNA-binding ferritin-like protein
MYQHMHWRSSGPNYYGDHLLFERLYDDIKDELDQVAERTIGMADDSNAVSPNEDAEVSAKILSKMISDNDSPDVFAEKSIVAEKGLIDLIRGLMEKEQSDGVEDLLQGIASKHEEHLYLLQQRARTASIGPVGRLFKLAYHLDLQGLYSEADEITKVMQSMSERVGLSGEDMVALADYFDAERYYKVADRFDKMAREYNPDKDPYLKLDQEDLSVGKEDPYIGLHQDVMVEKVLMAFKKGEISLTEAIESLTGDLNAYTEADSLMKSVEESLGREASCKKKV